MPNSVDTKNNAAGVAALAICESLMHALTDLKALSAKDARGVLEDVAAAHRNAEGPPEELAGHREVVAIIERMRAGLARA